ncbi:MAG TPA: MarR family winged helix-turn-helix transcriptional regulator [Bacteroidia bacterium]|nr:MarR family winged helix-turn-helix transcriptional regulator [Bacteroidia bacterium]
MKKKNQADSIGNLLMQINKAWRKKSNVLLSSVGLHSGQDVLLYYLSREDGQTVSSLAESLNITQATISIMINRMQISKVISKKKDSADKRTTRIYLTSKGKTIIPKIHEIWKTMENVTTKGLKKDQKDKLTSLLLTTLKNLE